MRLILAAMVGLLLSFSAVAQVTSTRETAYDWRCCDDAACNTQTVHQRQDKAFEACINRSAADGATRFVDGGRYRIEVTIEPPADPPAPTTGSVLLSWNAPTTRSDGSQLTNLAGYRVRYWVDPASPLLLEVADPAARQTRIEPLSTGLWHFAIAAYDAAGIESAYTDPVTKDVR